MTNKTRPLKLADPATVPMVCPHCHTAMDQASGVVDKSAKNAPLKPKPNDFTICIQCGYVAAFAENLSLRPLTKAEQAKVDADPRITRSVQALRMMRGAPH